MMAQYVEEDAEKASQSYNVAGNVKRYTRYENNLAFEKIKHTIFVHLRNFTIG